MSEENKIASTRRDSGGKRHTGLSRRQALARLGLAATAVYAAPTLLHLKGASAGSKKGSGDEGHGTGYGGGHGGGKGRGGGSGGGSGG